MPDGDVGVLRDEHDHPPNVIAISAIATRIITRPYTKWEIVSVKLRRNVDGARSG